MATDARENYKYKYYLNVCGAITGYPSTTHPCGQTKDQQLSWAACQTLADPHADAAAAGFPVGLGVYATPPELVDEVRFARR